MGELSLIVGPARSGKSRLAEQLAASYGDRVVYIATLEVLDDEMRRRVADHRAARPSTWQTIEEPLHVVERLRRVTEVDACLLDCMTLWTSNLMLSCAEGTSPAAVRRVLLDAVESLIAQQRRSGIPLIIVSNEVGAGIVPEYALGRLYRDLLGEANQLLGLAADRLYATVAGHYVELKSLGALPIPRSTGASESG